MTGNNGTISLGNVSNHSKENFTNNMIKNHNWLFSLTSECGDESLYKCSDKVEVFIYGFSVLFMGFAITCGNAMLPILFIRHKKLRTTYFATKVSLAICDGITGLILLVSILPNMVHDLSNTAKYTFHYFPANTATGIISGSLLQFSMLSSLLHMAVLSILRLVGIKWPISHSKIPIRVSTVGILMSWIIPIIVCVFPAIISKNHYAYKYYNPVFTYVIYEAITATNFTLKFVTTFLPYIITVTLNIYVGFLVWKKLKKASCLRTDDTNLRRQMQVVKTIFIMILAFTVTMVPYFIFILMSLAGSFQLPTVESKVKHNKVYAILYLLAVSNSFMNVLIYTARGHMSARRSEKKSSTNSKGTLV